MSTVIVKLKNGETHEHVEDTFQHQIGNGAVQIMFKDGSQIIYNDFERVDVVPSDEEKAEYMEQISRAEAKAKANAEAARLADEAENGANEPVPEDSIEGETKVAH